MGVHRGSEVWRWLFWSGVGLALFWAPRAWAQVVEGSREVEAGSVQVVEGSSEEGAGAVEVGAGSSEEGAGSVEQREGAAEEGEGAAEQREGAAEAGAGSLEMGTAPARAATDLCVGAALAEDEACVRLVWFGQTGGLSGPTLSSDAHERLFEAVGEQLSRLQPLGQGPRAFAQGGRLVFRPGGLTVAQFRQFLESLPRTQAAGGGRALVSAAFPYVEGPFEKIFEYPPHDLAPSLDYLERSLVGAARRRGRLWRYPFAGAEPVYVLEGEGVADAPLPTQTQDWMVRFAWEGLAEPSGGGAAPRHVFSVDRPTSEGVRRVAMLAELKAQDPEHTLLLAGGGDVEAFSLIHDGGADLQRPHTWWAYGQLGLDALAPAQSELALGLAQLQSEAQAAKVPLLSANAPELGLKGWRLRPVGPAQVLIIGLSEGAALDPADAVRQAILAARGELGRHPDLVVGIGSLSAQAKAQLVSQRTALDLLLTDFEDRGIAPERVHTEVSSLEEALLRRRINQPLSVVAAGRQRIGLAQVVLKRQAGGYRVQQVRSEARPVLAQQPYDALLMRRMQAVRQLAYEHEQRPLLPDLGPLIEGDAELKAIFSADAQVRRGARFGWAVSGRMTADLWRNLVASALRAQADAELVVLPKLPFAWPLVGPVDRLQAAANLNVPDRGVKVVWSAAKVRQLARSRQLGELTVVGLDATDPDAPKVLGRAVADREQYRVLLGDSLLQDARYRDLLTEAEPKVLWQLPAQHRAPLRRLALSALEGAQPAQMVDWLKAKPALESRWIWDARELALGGSHYGVYGPRDAYAQVRETRVSTGPNVALNLRSDLGLRREGVALDWLNRVRMDYAKSYLEDGVEQETADQVLLDTELHFRVLAFGSKADITPYTTMQFATEFTPTTYVEEGTGIERANPRKARLEGAVGLVYKPSWLDELRVAALVGHDFADAVAEPQWGGLVSLKLDRSVEWLRWRNELELRVYAPRVGAEVASELGGILRGRTSLDVPIFAGLGVGLFFDVFAYMGTPASTREPGASLVSGAMLNFDRLVKMAWGW